MLTIILRGMRVNNKLTIILLAVLLAGCDSKNTKTIECSSDVSSQTLTESLKKLALEQISEQTSKYEDVTNAIKRSTLDKILFDIKDITTTSKDPNSSMRTCSATVGIKIEPAQYSELADFYRLNYNKNLDRVMERFNLEQNANIFSARIDYTIQPTDDNKTIFVETSIDNSISSGSAFISTLAIVKPYREQEKLLLEKKNQEKIQAQAQAQYKIEHQDLALQRNNQLSNISLADSRDNFMAIDKKLSDAWHSLGKEKQKRLIITQRQWIKNKEAICGKISIKGTDQEVAKMFQCQYDMTKNRVSELMVE